ncbi:hypothetical protein IVB45_18590 [Bradyrhizobium sp. 4]|uniref:hypothetical protein n=1 Tax=unclassified Bradyrhizobium TaxID=2631580 RepID=UPI001FF7755C|nr:MULTISPECIES: hypothetical protein [unclassified Bradyrhizobium]MCK1400130.1 hypothetical protein [Bradyrhizobium sp. 39]MCK1750420.1 hypothetical protein [Bradyrhizobium sp. 135]UPJ32029.1 hypothetical protein IVB45_18590 [Bradyrhizobium sp. 4]
MAYSKDNLFILGGGVGGAPRVWIYSEASLPASSLDASGYISDGGKLGMRAKDLVLGLNTSTGIWSGHSVVTVNASTGAIDLSNGTTIADGSSNTD